jgi:hypothetical protein
LGDLETAVERAVKMKRVAPSDPLTMEACALLYECEVQL